MPDRALPSFTEFYRALHHRDPLPWQRRLADQVAAVGWPSGIGVPTGLGKTTCIDIAVWALAVSVSKPLVQRSLPTRTWYVVNRRLLVDAAYDQAKQLAAALAAAETAGQHEDPLHAVAAALRQIAAMGTESGGPLHVGLVRGGAPRTGQVPDPSMPALLFATVPMYASRWLFEAYGASSGSRPIEAALAGTDALVLLDESHLARPLRRLVEPLAACDPGGDSGLLPPGRRRPSFVELSATGSPGAFDLTEEDLAHPIVQRRLGATKPTRLVASTKTRINRELAEQAMTLVAANPASATVIFTNSPRRARAVHEQLRSLLRRQKMLCQPLLLTGRIREIEAARLRTVLLDSAGGAPSTGVPVPRDQPLVVIATQTLEVGADLDFDHLVTETAGARALVQRFGRLNRLGVRNATAAAVICHPVGSGEEGVYGAEPDAVWEELRRAAATGDLDLGPARIAQAVGEPQDQPPRTGEVLPAHLWEWAKTSCPPPDRAPIEPFVDGIEAPRPVVTVLWRAVLPPAPVARKGVGESDEEGGERVMPRLFPRVRAEETIELPLYEVREALLDRPTVQLHRVVNDGELQPIDRDLANRPTLRPGDVLILPCSAGLADEHGWNPVATDPVLDISPLASGSVVVDADLIRNLASDPPRALMTAVATVLAVDAESGDPVDRTPDTLGDLVGHLERLQLRTPSLQEDWNALIAKLERDRIVDEPGVSAHFAVHWKRSAWLRVAADAFDELSFDATSQELLAHGGAVGELARRTGAHLGFPEDVLAVLERAGQLHDIGKQDGRFQRWLDPDAKHLGQPLAKSSYDLTRSEAHRVAAGWPRGGRHEALSLRVARTLAAAERQTPDDELLFHLIATHHGYGRPGLPVAADPIAPRLTVQERRHEISIDADLGRPDWDQPERFRSLCMRYGYWGLALLETVLRKADHAASGRSSDRGATR